MLLTPSADGDENLLKEGVEPEKIHLVGNIMIDSLIEHKAKAERSNIHEVLGFQRDLDFALITLHRPSNVDELAGLKELLNAFAEIGKKIGLIFPMHPRTRKNIERLGINPLVDSIPNLIISEPIGYLDFMWLQMHAKFILTDSGGIQEESTYFGVPCLTLRENTERPITISEGTNQLVPLDTKSIGRQCNEILDGKVKKGTIPKYWDGNTAERVREVLDAFFRGLDDLQDSTSPAYRIRHVSCRLN